MSPLDTQMSEIPGRRLTDIVPQFGSRESGSPATRTLLNEDAFISMLYLERRRAERAQKRFVLVLVDVQETLAGNTKDRAVNGLANALFDATRETDIVGWYLSNNLLGIIGTELGNATNQAIQESLLRKIRTSFEESLGAKKAASIFVSFHFFPEEYEGRDDHTANIALYPDLQRTEKSRRLSLSLKRCMDVAGSAFALLLFSPIFAAIAIAIKLTSKGPVLFKQARLGQYGKEFQVLKFRSMRTDCDSKIHQEYVSQFIAGKVSGDATEGEKPVFKIQKDPRITRIGALIRKTSLDELPQFWNVLRGDMSLVGPRPPVAYEFRAYEVWHRRRVLEIKPGITGLWQVEGRSRTKFDEMVRLDLKYARGWSLWLDTKIILQTPAAVIFGEGAH